MSLAILFHFLCAQHVSDINMSIIRSLRLFCCITTLVVLFLVRCVLEIRCGWVFEACNTDTTPTQPHRISNTHWTKNNTTNLVIQQNSRKLLMMDILMSETCWAHKKWNKIASDSKLVFYSSVCFNVILLYIPRSSRWSIPLRVSKWNSFYFSSLASLVHNSLISSSSFSFSLAAGLLSFTKSDSFAKLIYFFDYANYVC